VVHPRLDGVATLGRALARLREVLGHRTGADRGVCSSFIRTQGGSQRSRTSARREPQRRVAPHIDALCGLVPFKGPRGGPRDRPAATVLRTR